jgi:hypothetical protein
MMTIKEFLNPNETKKQLLESLKNSIFFLLRLSLQIGYCVLIIKMIPILYKLIVEVLNIGGPLGGL